MTNVGSIIIDIFANTDRLDRDLNSAQQRLESAGKNMTDIGAKLTVGLTLPILAVGTAAAKAGMDFEAGMSQVAAISGATAADMSRLEEKAKEIGATTKFSATEASEALKYMALAGWDTETSLGAISGVMNLAAASGENLALVSDIVTDSMTAFKLESKDTSMFVDVLASTAASSNTNIAMLGEAFKYAAPIAGTLGVSVQDAALALGLMANAGIKASMAGTALRTTLTNMAAGNKDTLDAFKALKIEINDTEGKMRPFRDILSDLREKFNNLSKSNQALAGEMISGKFALSGFLAMVTASDKDFNKLQNNIDNSAGKADEMSKIMQDNLAGSFTILKSSAEALFISLSEKINPVIQFLTEKAIVAVNWLNSLSDTTKVTAITMAALAAAIGPLLLVTGSAITIWATFGAVISSFALPAALAIVAIGSVVAAGYKFYSDFDDINGGVRIILLDLQNTFWEVLSYISELTFKAVDKILAGLERITTFIPKLGARVTAAREAYKSLDKEATLSMLHKQLDISTQKTNIFNAATLRQQETLKNGNSTLDELKSALDNAKSSTESSSKSMMDFTGAIEETEKASEKAKNAEKEREKAVKKAASEAKKAAKEIEKAKKDEIKATEKALKEMEKIYKENKKVLVESYTDLGEGIQKALERMYDRQFKMQEKYSKRHIAIQQRETDMLLKEYDRRYKEQLQNLEDTEKAQVKSIREQIDAIDAQTEAEEKAIREMEFVTEKADLESEIKVKTTEVESAKKEMLLLEGAWKLSSDERRKTLIKEYNEAKKIVKDGSEDIADAKKEIEELVRNRERELLLEKREEQKKALELEMEQIQEQTELKKENLEKEYELEKSLLEDSAKRKIANYEAMISEAKLYHDEKIRQENIEAEAKKIITDNNQAELIDLLEEYYPEWYSAGKNFGERLLDGVEEMEGPIKHKIANIVGTINQAINRLKVLQSMSGGSFGSSSISVPSFAVGTNYVPQDTLAMVHKGEAIIPKEYNKPYQPPSSGGGGITININGNISNRQDARNYGNQMVSILRAAGVKTE